MPTSKAANQRSYAGYQGFVAANGGVPAAPANTVAPAITGTAKVGETLTSTTGTWSGRPTPTFSRQWKRDGLAINGATAATYVPVVADIDAEITITVTGASVAGSKAATSAATDAVIAA